MEDIEPQDIPRLLSLAAEHDRVDIIQELVVRAKELNKNDESGIAILNHCKQMVSSEKSENTNERMENECNESLPFIPPLHIAIASGSVHASTCLLRMGADPSIRPQIQGSLMDTEQEEYKSLLKYHDLSAFELLASINLATGKKRGIQHAFFAEALRAIGSDDVSRLECLLKSGMKAGNEYEKYDDNDKEKENEKTLLDWAVDMTEDENLNPCVVLLKSWGKPPSTDGKEKNEKNHPQSKDNPQSSSPESPHMERMKDLSRRIEEAQSLEYSLEPILKDLIQETNICRALIHGRVSESSSETTSPLLKHVKMMKALKAQKDVELDQYQRLLEKTRYEERRLKHIFQKQHTSLSAEKISEWEIRMERYLSSTQAAHKSTCKNLDGNNAEIGNEHIIQDLTSKLDATEMRVRTLRASLVDVSEENARVRAEVKELGLSGAVRLANTLREELIECESRVKEEKERVELCQERCQEWNIKINMMNGSEFVQPSEHDEEKVEEVDLDQGTDKDSFVIVSDEEHVDEEEEEYSDSEYEEYEEYSDEYTTSSGEYEEYTDDDEEYDEEEYDEDEYDEGDYDEEDFEEEDKNVDVHSKPSLKIKHGHSQEIVVRQNSYFTLEIWGLLCRIVGFGKTAVKEVKKKHKSIGRQSTGVMIV